MLTPGGTVGRHIANAPVAFNVLGVLLFIGFEPLASKLLYRIIPASRRVGTRGNEVVDNAEPAVAETNV